jgi:DinB superfamily
MRTVQRILVMAICMAAPMVVRAQSSPANPVVASAREIFDRQAKYITAAADEMPADKYGYHPTPEQWSFGKIISHIAQVNLVVCSILSDAPAPPNGKVTESDPKEKLVAALKSSFDFCSDGLTNLTDSKLGDTVKFFRGRQVPRARALFELTGDLEDHYSQLASYLRLNGMLPPSAKPAN